MSAYLQPESRTFQNDSPIYGRATGNLSNTKTEPHTERQGLQLQAPDAKVRMHLVFLKYRTLNLMPLMVYPKVLFHSNSSIIAASKGGKKETDEK